MSPFRKVLAACLTTAALVAPAVALAADNDAVACTVNIEITRNGLQVELYQKDFVVTPAVPFRDDFSTRTRSKTFDASVVRNAGNLLVTIDYFSDVGVFHAIGLNTNLTIHGAGGIESTSGRNTFATSTAVTPESVAGNHLTNHQLICRRA